APPPLRAPRLGRGEDHPAFLDRRNHRRPDRRDPLPRPDRSAPVSSMTMEPLTRRPVDPDGLSMDGIRDGALGGRAVTVLGFARSGIALARFLVAEGAAVTIYDGRPAAELAAAIDALEGRSVHLLL